MMYRHWSLQVKRGHNPTPRDLVTACGVSIHAARAAIRRYKAGRFPRPQPKGLQPKTVRNIHVMLHRALLDAKGWKYIIDNPAAAATPPRVTRKKRPIWNPEQASRFMAHIRRDRFYALFRLELTTGQRRVEYAESDGLRSISTEGSIDPREPCGRRRPCSGRPSQDRRLRSTELPRPGHRPSTARLDNRPDAEREFFGADYQDTDLVFTWDDGRPVHPDSIRERFKRLAAEAGLPEIRFYDLRHSYVTGALAAGISPKVVSERVGHADVAFTLKTYSHVLPGMDYDAAIRGASYLLGGTDPNPPERGDPKS